MAFISKISSFFLGQTALLTEPTGVWGKIIMAFNGGIHNYAWAIVVLTIVLKVIMLPLDFFNKKITAKNTKIQAVIQPEIAKIQKQYGNNRQMINQKTMEIYKKHNYNVTGSCVIMLVNMALTLFIFITLFSGLNSMAAYKVGYQYQEMEKTYLEYTYGSDEIETDYEKYQVAYNAAYTEAFNSYKTGEETDEDVTAEEKQLATETAKQTAEATTGTTEEKIKNVINEKVVETYNGVKESWLWIENVWKADTPWTKSETSFNEFISMARIRYVDKLDEGQEPTFTQRLSSQKESDQIIYENVVSAISSQNRVNGYLIIPLLAVASTIISLLATQGKIRFRKKKKDEADMPKQPGGLVMPILMAGIMAYITLSYNSVFSLYILVSSLIGIATTPLINLCIKKLDERQLKKQEEKKKEQVSYRR